MEREGSDNFTLNSFPVSSGPLAVPLLTIAVTTYNRAAWLSLSLPLLLERTGPYQDVVEVVVCDNASTDDTREVVSGFARHPQLRYYRNQVNVGMLGNLGVSGGHARGRYVWLIGDDDLMIEGAIERVLAALLRFPETELLYMNYAFTRFDKPEQLACIEPLIRKALPISTNFRDERAPELRTIAAKTENCFTGIYSMVFRADHARRAYGQDVSGPPFLTLPTCAPSADYVCRHMMGRPGYWLGDPCVVVNMNVSWMKHAALFILERFPELHDLMQANGVESADVDRLRSVHMPNVMNWLLEIYSGRQKENLSHFSIDRLIRRLRHLPSFRRQWGFVFDLYKNACRIGLVPTEGVAPEMVERIYLNG